MQDFSFQGKVYLGARQTNGKPGAMAWVGDASVLQVALQSDVSTRNESYSGNRLPSARLSKAKTATVKLTLNDFSAANLALGLYGDANVIASGSVATGSPETLPIGIVVGDSIMLAHTNVSAVVIKDSAGTPATLVSGTDYVVDSANGGVVRFLNIGTYTQPFKASYSYGGGTDLAMFIEEAPERYLILDGFNTVEGDSSPVRVQLYRVVFDPASTLDLISNDFGTLELSGSCLYDSVNAADATLGGFGKISIPTET